MKYISVIIFILLTVTSNAQEKKWTLQECMQYAVENSPRKNKQEAQNKIYNQNYIEAIGKLLPSVQAGTSTYFNFGRGLDAETNTYTDINSFSNNYSLYSSLTLFDGLTNITKIKIQKVNQLMGKQQLQEAKDMIAYETMEAFFNVLYYKETVKLAEQQLMESSENLRQVQRMEELGMKGFPDVAEIKAKEATDNYNLTRQKNLTAVGIIQLKEKMNFPIDEEIDIMDYTSDEIISKSTDTAINVYDQSLSFLPKVLAIDASLQAQKLSYKSAKGSLFPAISVDAGLSTNFSRYMDGSAYSSFRNQFRDKRGSYVGFTLSIPVFNGFSSTAQVKRSKYQMTITQNEKDEKFRAIYSEIEQAIADMNGQADEYYQARKQVEALTVAHNVNNRKYKEGLISALEFHTSSNRLLQAKVNELNAKLKFYLKCKLVKYYKGEPFITE
ncbi:MAG: TolC family protein [Rikenellaceae bacterium]